MSRRSPVPPALTILVMAGAGVWLLPLGPSPRAQAVDPEPAIRWEQAVSPGATVRIDIPPGWEVIEPVEPGDATRIRPLDGTPCDVRVEFVLASGAQPPVGSAEALRAMVDGEARAFLDQAVESRYALRELQGPEAAGYYFMLRDRSPRRKGAVFLNRGALLVRDAVVRFSIETPKPDLPAIRQALKMLAGSRLQRVAPPTVPESAGAPAASTSAARTEPGIGD
ncbi:MAG TPA: hypothetical protein VFD06_09445 [Candidatus Polarisedimenticolia bacterium]|nr:hypothetical protein [Candidatus Polarisedimenticolia bacterium]